MKILLVGVNYSPEITGIAPYTTAMAEGLVASGHDVRVITGVPHYPRWRNYTNFTGIRRDEVVSGVPVRRVRHYIGSGGQGFGRIMQELTFGLNAAAQSWRDVDVVLCVSPPLIGATVAVAKARLLRIPIGVWVQDLYANGAREISGRAGVLARALTMLESVTLRSATGVLVIHDRFKRAIVRTLGIPEDRVTVSRNWSHLGSESTVEPLDVRRRYFGSAPIIALHTGNMGAKQGLGNIVEAARIADTTGSDVVFGLVGDGSQRVRLEAMGKDVAHLVFVPSLTNAEYGALLAAADVLLVNEKAGLRESAVPSKLTSYFVQGKPVVAATEFDSATADEVVAAGAGPVIEPDRPRLLLKTIEQVAGDRAQATLFGERARAFAATNLTPHSAVNRVCGWLQGLVDEERTAGDA